VTPTAKRYWFVDSEARARALQLPGDFDDVAWARDDALDAIECARRKYVAILGGDVWERHGQGSNLSITHDNWYSSQHDGESDESYVKRSCDEARHFIRGFDSTREYAFVIVPRVSP
jgi:hypothetical protein